jgi:hypothetical protein
MAVSHAAGRGGLAGVSARIVPWRQLAIGIVNVSDRLTAARPPEPRARPAAACELCPPPFSLSRTTDAPQAPRARTIGAAVPPRPAQDPSSGRARPLEAGHPVRHQIVEPQVAHLQLCNLVESTLTRRQPNVTTTVSSRRGKRDSAAPAFPAATQATSAPSPSSWVASAPRDGNESSRAAELLGPVREFVDLAHRRRKMELTALVPSLHRLTNQLDSRRRHSETSQVSMASDVASQGGGAGPGRDRYRWTR